MENASKALIITGGVFVAIVILVIGLELFVGYRKVAETYDSKMTMSEISEINKEFTKYLAKGKKITIQEVVTAIRTAQNYNKKYGYTMITVNVTGIPNTMNSKNEDFAEIIKGIIDQVNSGNQQTYEVDTIKYWNDDNDKHKGVIKTINFIKVH